MPPVEESVNFVLYFYLPITQRFLLWFFFSPDCSTPPDILVPENFFHLKQTLKFFAISFSLEIYQAICCSCIFPSLPLPNISSSMNPTSTKHMHKHLLVWCTGTKQGTKSILYPIQRAREKEEHILGSETYYFNQEEFFSCLSSWLK